jgi:hypothetical protein
MEAITYVFLIFLYNVAPQVSNVSPQNCVRNQWSSPLRFRVEKLSLIEFHPNLFPPRMHLRVSASFRMDSRRNFCLRVRLKQACPTFYSFRYTAVKTFIKIIFQPSHLSSFTPGNTGYRYCRGHMSLSFNSWDNWGIFTELAMYTMPIEAATDL